MGSHKYLLALMSSASPFYLDINVITKDGKICISLSPYLSSIARSLLSSRLFAHYSVRHSDNITHLIFAFTEKLTQQMVLGTLWSCTDYRIFKVLASLKWELSPKVMKNSHIEVH